MEDLEKQYNDSTCWGLSCSVDIKGCNPGSIRDEHVIKRYVKELIELIQMKAHGECQVIHFGEDEKVAGFSMVQLIETSLISGHFANKTNTAYIDIFSCKFFNPSIVAEFTQNFFNGDEVTVRFSIRR